MVSEVIIALLDICECRRFKIIEMCAYALYVRKCLHTPYTFFFHVLLSYMNLYAVNMMSSASMLTHTCIQPTSMVAFIQDPYSEFHSHIVHVDCYGPY